MFSHRTFSWKQVDLVFLILTDLTISMDLKITKCKPAAPSPGVPTSWCSWPERKRFSFCFQSPKLEPPMSTGCPSGPLTTWPTCWRLTGRSRRCLTWKTIELMIRTNFNRRKNIDFYHLTIIFYISFSFLLKRLIFRQSWVLWISQTNKFMQTGIW